MMLAVSGHTLMVIAGMYATGWVVWVLVNLAFERRNERRRREAWDRYWAVREEIERERRAGIWDD